jgi:hypothetical protein
MAPVANRREPSEITESLDLSRIVNYPRLVASTGNVSHASTGNVLPWLSPPGEPVIVRVSSPDSRWYAWVTGFPAVSFVDLESVTYADGTSARLEWNALPGAGSSFGLVNNQTGGLSIRFVSARCLRSARC